MLIIFPILGVNVVEQREEVSATARLRLSGPGAEAEGVETEAGFLVSAGAHARAEVVESMPKWVTWAAKLRDTLIQSGNLAEVPGEASLPLTTNYLFKSPSARRGSAHGPWRKRPA